MHPQFDNNLSYWMFVTDAKGKQLYEAPVYGKLLPTGEFILNVQTTEQSVLNKLSSFKECKVRFEQAWHVCDEWELKPKILTSGSDNV